VGKQLVIKLDGALAGEIIIFLTNLSDIEQKFQNLTKFDEKYEFHQICLKIDCF